MADYIIRVNQSIADCVIKVDGRMGPQGDVTPAALEAKKIAETAATNAKLNADASANSAITAGQYAVNAASSAATAFGATAPAYNPTTTYNFPEVVADTDGYTYRCVGTGVIGESPKTSIHWVRVTMAYGDFFELDGDGDYMPSVSPKDSGIFKLDEDGDIYPV